MIDTLLHSLTGNYSTILMLHRIASFKPDRLPANQNMNVSPEALAAFINIMKKRGWTFLSLDELYERLVNKKKIKKTLLLTADDGYRDNLTKGLQVISACNVPLCIYVTTSFPDRTAKLWWYALEDALFFEAKKDSKPYDVSVINEIFMKLRACYLASYDNPDKFFEDYFPSFKPDWLSYCDKYCLNWKEIELLSKDPYITIGAHTVSHGSLKALEYDDAWHEIEYSRLRIEDKILKKIDHFCYPYGGSEEAFLREYAMVKDMGFKTATTTIFGNVLPVHKNHLTSLPRYIYKQNDSISRVAKFKDNIKYSIKNLYENVSQW